MTTIFQVDPEHIDTGIMEQAAALLRDGKLVAFPTETVYGIGANALDAAAVDKIYITKKRPKSDPLIVHIATMEQLAQVVDNMPELGRQLAEQFWPGPLTLIVKKNPDIPDNVTSGQQSVAVRMPAHPIALELIRRAAVPVAAPSANLFSRPSSTSGRHVLEDFSSGIDMILDGGESTIGVESTVINLTENPPEILRPGGLAFEDLLAIIPDLRLKTSHAGENETVVSPGMLLKHYSPKARLLLFEGDNDSLVLQRMLEEASRLESSGLKVGVLSTASQSRQLSGQQRVIYELGAAGDLVTISKNLYKGLRSLDEQAVDTILVSAPTSEGLGLAIRDRLFRAAEGHIIRVD